MVNIQKGVMRVYSSSTLCFGHYPSPPNPLVLNPIKKYNSASRLEHGTSCTVDWPWKCTDGRRVDNAESVALEEEGICIEDIELIEDDRDCVVDEDCKAIDAEDIEEIDEDRLGDDEEDMLIFAAAALAGLD
jgi:hypothetical protein